MKTITRFALLSALALAITSNAHAGHLSFGISIGFGGGHRLPPPVIVTAPIVVPSCPPPYICPPRVVVEPQCAPLPCTPAPIEIVISERVYFDNGWRMVPCRYRAVWSHRQACYTYTDRGGINRCYRRYSR